MHRVSKPFLLFFTIVPAVVVGLSCKGKSPDKPKENPPVMVDVMIASLRPVNNTIEANGTVIANESVELRPEVSGRLTYLNVPEGEYVAQGTVLARINSADLAAQVQKSRVQLQLAEANERRLHILLEAGGVNQVDYDAVVNQVNTLRADIAYTQTLIDKTVIRAPFSGTIGLRQVSPGAYVSPSTIIATIQQLGKAKIDFTLPEQYSELIGVGKFVEVEVEDTGATRDRATIIAMEPQAIRQTRNIMVRAMLENTAPNPGGFVKVYVRSSGENSQSVMVPTNTIIPNDKSSQLILVKKGKAAFVDVQTGMRSAGNVEITRGVNPGDTIVVTGVLFARPNAALKIRSVKTLEQLNSQQ
ncbi:MAG: efflux RND transporter periplasmic adaptor subunit [Chitinophagaceae bacterium]